jgi:hypothetical protein
MKHMPTRWQLIGYVALPYILGLLIYCAWKGFTCGWEFKLLVTGALFVAMAGIGLIILEGLFYFARRQLGR